MSIDVKKLGGLAVLLGLLLARAAQTQYRTGVAGYNPYTGTYGRAAAGYNPYTGTHAGSRTYYNPYTGTAGRVRGAYNPYTGSYAVRGRAYRR
jgi:hypothetical protein